MTKDFAKLCTPAKIYFAIAVLSSLLALIYNTPILAVFIKLIFSFIWAFILNWLCNNGFTVVSWVLVLLPYVLILLSVIGIASATAVTQKQQDTRKERKQRRDVL